MTTTSPHGNQNQSSCTKVPAVPSEGLPLDPAQDQDVASNQTPDPSKETKIGSDPNPDGPSVCSNTNLAKLYSTVEDKKNTTLDEINNKNCDYSQKLALKMSPVEGPVNDIPKNNEAAIVKISNNSQNGKLDKSKNADEIDGEEFSGQIVYNPDGSAYILEESDETLLEQIPTQEGAIVERAGKHSSEVEYPRIDQAIYIARRRAWYNAMGNAYLQLMQEKSPESPVIHNFKVVSVNDKTALKVKKEQKTTEETSEGKELLAEISNVPVKPILMCFICKLSFSYAKSFVAHSTTEHNVELNEKEKDILCYPDTSAILQCVGSTRKPLLSFLEPVLEDNSSTNNNTNTNSIATSLVSRNLMIPPLFRTNASSPITIDDCSKEDLSPFPGFPQVQTSPSTNMLSSLRLPFGPGFNNGLLSVMGSNQIIGPPPPTNASQLQGTTIGPCPDHVNGRQPGVECQKCDFILNSSKLGESWNMTVNPAKVLKCPKCNWHYKYQETLEVHMKDKHPESNSNCIYCITGQQHPRLARGETYTCGYKPYRCEVCNYSTTTKGNLSIHMQSDKHINNMQELQNGGVVTAADGTKITQNSLAQLPLAQRLNATNPIQQPSAWRCDICNYETNIPRNLRIHMTSEKHVQNVTAMQQNMKNLQGLQLLQNLTNPEKSGFPPMPPLQPVNEMMMMMDMAQNQAMFLQLMASRHNPFQSPQASEQIMGSDALEPANEVLDPNPTKLFNCCICREFNTDTLEALSSHIAIDRSNEGEGEVAVVITGTHICKLCSYKTNLKANFQLHSKTDKHLARLSLFNHIREGGPANEWKLNMLAGTNPTQLRCNACDYNTNSLHKLQAHVHSQSHEVSIILFSHLCQAENNMQDIERISYSCTLCRFSGRGKASLLSHARTLTHIRAEQLAEARRQAEGGDQPDIGDIFTVGESQDGEQAESSETGELIQRKTNNPCFKFQKK